MSVLSQSKISSGVKAAIGDEQTSDVSEEFNQALNYTISTSEYRSMLHAISICSANATDIQSAMLKLRLTELVNALQYELSEVFEVASTEDEIAKVGVLSFLEDVVSEMNASYMSGLNGCAGEGKYPWLYKVSTIRKNNPHTLAEGSLIHIATEKIQSLADSVRNAANAGEEELLDGLMETMRYWTDVLICHPSRYRILGSEIVKSIKGEGYPKTFVDSFLASLDDKSFKLLFGEKAFDAVVESATASEDTVG